MSCLFIPYSPQFAVERVAGYVKRLFIVLLYVGVDTAAAFLSVTKQLLSQFPRTQQLLDTEVTNTGIYLPEVENPEHSNAFTTTAWEYTLLQHHFHPAIAKLSKSVFTMEEFALTISPSTIFDKFDFHRFGVVPSIPLPKPHPLVKAKDKRGGKDVWVRPSVLYEASPFLSEIESKAKQPAKPQWAPYFDQLTQ